MRLRNITKICLTTISAMAALSTMKEARAQAFNPNNPTASGYTLVFNSQFSGSTLPTTQWSTGWAWSQGSGLNSTYPNDEGLPSNITFQNGAMNLAATKGPTPSRKAYGTAVITSYGKFSQTYGYWQASIQFPTNAHGIWPAFWLVPTDFSWPPEIDIMEGLGVLPNTDYMTLHYGARNSQTGCTYTSSGLDAGFHTLGLLWTKTSVAWYVDGVQECSATAKNSIPQRPMYIILNIDTGGWNNNIVDSTTVFPALLKVANVQVYKAP